MKEHDNLDWDTSAGHYFVVLIGRHIGWNRNILPRKNLCDVHSLWKIRENVHSTVHMGKTSSWRCYSTGSTDYFVLFSCQHRLSGAQIHQRIFNCGFSSIFALRAAWWFIQDGGSLERKNCSHLRANTQRLTLLSLVSTIMCRLYRLSFFNPLHCIFN